MDLRAASKFLAIAALLAGAWVAVRLLKPKEAELTALDSRSAEFGDMSSAAERRAGAPGAPDDVSGLDMVPSSSLPLSAPAAPPEPAPEAASKTSEAALPGDSAGSPSPAAPAPRREKPRLQRSGSVLDGEAARSSAFLAAPEDEKKKPKR